MSEYIIEAQNVARAFDGKPVVRDLNLRVRRGSIYGFLGRNGAGKTTTIKMLVGLIRRDAGELRVCGADPWRFTVADRQRVGYLSEKQTLMPAMRVGRLIEFTANFYPNWDDAMCDRILKRFKLDPDKRIKELSGGQQRQVGFLLALAQRPDLLVLDEPASTLDVVARREFLDEVLELLRSEGKSVLFSSHILSDVERVADEVGIMADGTLKLSEPLDRLKETVKQVRLYDFPNGTDGLAVPGAFQLRKTPTEALVTLRVTDDATLTQLAATHRCRCEMRDLSLEDIFVEVVREPEGKV